MQMIVDDIKEKKSSKIYSKFLELSEKLGDVIYNDKNITVTNIINKIKPKLPQKQLPKPQQSKKIPDMMVSYIDQERNVRRTVGMGIISIVILVVVVGVLYAINYIFSMLLDIMEWWLLAIITLGVIIPLFLAIAYLIAKGDY